MPDPKKMIRPRGAQARLYGQRYRYGATQAKGAALQIDEPSAAELAAYTKPLSQMEVDSESTDQSDSGGSGDET